MERYSRRATLFIGTWGQMLSEGLMAILASIPNQTPALVWCVLLSSAGELKSLK